VNDFGHRPVSPPVFQEKVADLIITDTAGSHTGADMARQIATSAN
jgi:hypothetical protein